MLNVPIGQPFLIVVGNRLLDSFGRDADRQIRRVVHELALGDLDVLIDVAACLLEQAIALGGGRRPNAGFLGCNLLCALRAQRLKLAGKRLHPAIDLFELRRGLLFHSSGVD